MLDSIQSHGRSYFLDSYDRFGAQTYGCNFYLLGLHGFDSYISQITITN